MRKFSKQVENTVGKGDIACYEQFLLFPQCFQKACFPGVSMCGNGLAHYQTTNFRLFQTERVCRRQFQI